VSAARDRLVAATTEDELLQVITEAATYRGWRWHHVRRSDKALQMGHSGFPDLVLSRDGRTLMLELKRVGQFARPDQEAWIEAVNGPTLLPNAKVQAYQIDPTQIDVVLRWLE